MFKILVKFMKPNNLEAGVYELSHSMNLKTIINTLSNGAKDTRETVKITFVEGKNMRSVAKVIAKSTNNTEEDVYNLLEDDEYIDSLIEKYWFLNEDIKNEDIYYSLE